jgi:NADP-dependent 3-hydroxy acid dehydrogenase YdfG
MISDKEKLQELELRLSNYENIKENLDIKNRCIKSFIKSLPKSFLIDCLVEMKIIKKDYVTREITEI